MGIASLTKNNMSYLLIGQDANARVVNTEDRPIPGRYVADAAAGGIWYAADVSGSQLGGCMVFGRLAARHAAARAKKA